MTVERLAADDYPALKNVSDGFVPDPANSIAIVAKDSGEIVGRIFIVAPAHIEGPWIAPAKRGGMLLVHLISRAEREARKAGIKKLMAYGTSPQTEDYLKRLGFGQLPLTVWAKDI